MADTTRNTAAATPEAPASRRNEKVGTVVSTKMQKTIVVEIEMRKAHPKYKRVMKSNKKFYAHDEQNSERARKVASSREIVPGARAVASIATRKALKSSASLRPSSIKKSTDRRRPLPAQIMAQPRGRPQIFALFTGDLTRSCSPRLFGAGDAECRRFSRIPRPWAGSRSSRTFPALPGRT